MQRVLFSYNPKTFRFEVASLIGSGYGLHIQRLYTASSRHNRLEVPAFRGREMVVVRTGRGIEVRISFGYETRYAHPERFIVQPDTFVQGGQLIGHVGNTVISVSPLLHFYKVYHHEIPVNPIHFFQLHLEVS